MLKEMLHCTSAACGVYMAQLDLKCQCFLEKDLIVWTWKCEIFNLHGV